MTEMANEAKGEKSTFYDNLRTTLRRKPFKAKLKHPKTMVFILYIVNHGIQTLYCHDMRLGEFLSRDALVSASIVSRWPYFCSQ